MSKLDKVINYTLNNNGGTFNKNMDNVNSGYVVAYKTLYIMKHLYYNDVKINLMKAFEEVQERNNLVVGTRVYKNNLYIELSKIYDNIEDALKVARKNNEYSIYDLTNNKEIIL